MLTKEEIEGAQDSLIANHLSDVAQRQWLTLIRGFDGYRSNPGLYANLAQKLAGATGITAQILQAALTKIEAIGSGQESLGSEASAGVSWSRADNRNELILDGLNALYDVPAVRPTSAVVKTDWGAFRCSLHGCLRSVCGCGYGLRFPLL
ncbi:MAG TPA: hypothetical protein VF708_19970 [Pyrinomonadaceae bacterium]|jgi:hypothetical protein